jgi:uncharacterized protein (TIGR02246 family)
MTDDLVSIAKLYAENAAALGSGDIDALARFYEIDAIQFPPDAPAIRGWKAIRAALEEQLEMVSASASVQVNEFVATGGWAFACGSYRTVAVPRGGGQETEACGNWLDVLRRQPDGSWRILRSTWTSRQ